MEPKQEQQDSKEIHVKEEEKIMRDFFEARRKIENAKKFGFKGEPQSLSQRMEEVKQRLKIANRSLNRKEPRNLQRIMEEAQRQLESAKKFGFREEPKMTRKAKRQAQLFKDTTYKLRSQVDTLSVAKNNLIGLRDIMDGEAVTINNMIQISYAAVESLMGITEIGPRGHNFTKCEAEDTINGPVQPDTEVHKDT